MRNYLELPHDLRMLIQDFVIRYDTEEIVLMYVSSNFLLRDDKTSIFRANKANVHYFADSLQLLVWADAKGFLRYAGILLCAHAARRGYLEILEWLSKQHYLWYNHEICKNAAKEDRLEVLKWARQNGCPWDIRTCIAAAGGGRSS